jgi:phage-related baseplate assembly protein
MYLLGYDVNGNLTVLNDAVKQNIKTYLEEYRMLTDAVNMLDGFVINVGINYEVTIYSNYNKREVLLKANNALKNYFDITKWQINQPINLSEIELEIANIDGVSAVQKVEVVNLKGGNYSTYGYNVVEATRNKIIYPSLDPAIFEIKFPNTDIKGRAI